ncbi:MAG: sacsin N-terminal ATP-binding-like domain-containing protein [Candidatus Baldrarchaeia archaeon]
MFFDYGNSVVNRIKDELLESAETRVGKSLDEVLKIIPDAVFLRTTRFIMELLQNAEDACMEINNENGFFKIHLNNRRIKIVHNGKPFDEKDLESLCAIGSSKKPEKGYIGYLGIGFKSVFKVSDKVYVFSGPFRFKFDREHWVKLGKEKYGLWPITPVPIDPSEITETIENKNLTTFLIYFRGKSEQEWRNYYNEVWKELERITPPYFSIFKAY